MKRNVRFSHNTTKALGSCLFCFWILVGQQRLVPILRSCPNPSSRRASTLHYLARHPFAIAAMLLVHMLYPRFLVLEIVLFFHVIHEGQACKKVFSSSKESQPASTPAPPPLPTCSIDLNVIHLKYLPLFLSPTDGTSAAGSALSLSSPFILPSPGLNATQRLVAFRGDTVLTCPGAKLKVSDRVTSRIKCLSGGITFQLLDDEDEDSQALRQVSFMDLSCSRSIREKVRKTEQACGPAGGEGRLVHIGWPHGDRFHRQISVCHDARREQTHFSNHTIYGAAILAKNVLARRASYFKEGGFYKRSRPDQLYKLPTQQETFKEVLGEREAQRVFDYRQHYLAKGHLAPDADFLYKEWQDATYYFINVAPQWQSFNNGNWRAVESAVRDYAGRTKADVRVYTGTLGVLKLRPRSSRGRLLRPAEIFLEQGDRIPVPEFYWKIAHNPQSDRAVVFVGLNNPHFDGDAAREAQICPDQCRGMGWTFPDQGNVTKGYVYCCSYLDFKGVIDWVPDLGRPDVLYNV